jgi:hypothetical protein
VLGAVLGGAGLAVVAAAEGEGDAALVDGDADAAGIGEVAGVSGFAAAAGLALVCTAQPAVAPARASTAPDFARARDIRRNRLTHFCRGPPTDRRIQDDSRAARVAAVSES